MCAQPRQIVIKKPHLIVKKKEMGRAWGYGTPPHANLHTPPDAHPSSTYCNQCGGRRILPGAPQFFDFHCAYCGQVNQSRGYVSGKEIQCIACGNGILIPPPPLRPVPAHLGGPSKANQRLKFYCVFCGQKLSASTDMTGRVISCPSCGNKIEVPQVP